MSPSPRKRATSLGKPLPTVTWRQGVHLVGSALWCDALRAHGLCFVSSVRAIPRARKRAGTLLTTQTTLSLLSALHRAPEGAQLLSPLRRPFFWGSLRLELFANSDLPGSASLWVKLPSEERVIVAGQPSEQSSELLEPLQLRQAETLVIAAPWAPLHLELPTIDAMAHSVRSELALAKAMGVPLLVRCSSVVKLAELVGKLDLGPLKLHVDLHRVWQWCQSLPRFPKLHSVSVRTVAPGDVLWWPPAAPPPKLPVAPRELHLADGLSRAGLVRYARGSGVRQVYLTAGFSSEVAAALSVHKIGAAPLGPPQQLALFGEFAAP